MTPKKELAELNPGDDIAIRTSGFGGRYILTKVDRITNTLIIDAQGRRFSKKHGYEPGRIYHGYFAQALTPEILQQVKEEKEADIKERFVTELMSLHWTPLRKLPTKSLAAACKSLNLKCGDDAEVN